MQISSIIIYQELEINADFQINLNNSRENGVSLHQNIANMRYKIKKETKPTLPTFGKYKAVAVHNQVIESRQLCDEAASRGMAISGGVLEGLLMAVGETMMRHLQMGDKVRLKNFGLFKLEIESEKVDDPKTFRAKKHIRGVRLHFIPESYEGSQPLYEGITYEKEK
jgi:nucleoid DNA-binding protein